MSYVDGICELEMLDERQVSQLTTIPVKDAAKLALRGSGTVFPQVRYESSLRQSGCPQVHCSKQARPIRAGKLEDRA